MLEIPESHALAKQLQETVLGKEIAHVIAAQSPHGFSFYSGDPALYPGLLNGKCVDGARAEAGQVELYFGDMRLMVHDGVNMRFLRPDAIPPAKHQLLIEFDDGSKLVCTVQMYGGMYAFKAGTNENYYYLVARDKPSPLTDAFDKAYFETLLTDPKLSVKALLATNQRIPGLGNGCLQDILYNARMHPQTKVRALSDSALGALYQSVKQTLKQMADAGGRDTEKDLFGNPGGYRTILSSKTLPYPCMQCGGGITRKAYLGGNIYFCAACQPLE